MKTAVIEIEFTSFWLSGTGQAASRDVDAACHRDAFGCPCMPMTQVKGILRESAARLAKRNSGGAVEQWTDDLVTQIFGAEGDKAGALAWRGDAHLPDADRRFFKTNPREREQLFHIVRSTKIHELGAAESEHLRAVEAAAPMTLCGDIHAEGATPSEWRKLLNQACAVSIAFGKLKTDGFGRALARMRKEGDAS